MFISLKGEISADSRQTTAVSTNLHAATPLISHTLLAEGDENLQAPSVIAPAMTPAADSAIPSDGQ